MLYQSPVSKTDMKLRSSDAQALFEHIHKSHESPSAFVKEVTGKEDRKDHNAEYQLLLRLIDKEKPFSRKMWKRLSDVFGIDRDELQKLKKVNTIIGDRNIQDSRNINLPREEATDKERELELMNEINRLKDELIKAKDKIIELTSKNTNGKND